jgi:hypothetical protein
MLSFHLGSECSGLASWETNWVYNIRIHNGNFWRSGVNMTYSSHHSFTSAAILDKRYYVKIPYQRSLSEILLKKHATSSFHLLWSTALIKVWNERLVVSTPKATSLIGNLQVTLVAITLLTLDSLWYKHELLSITIFYSTLRTIIELLRSYDLTS